MTMTVPDGPVSCEDFAQRIAMAGFVTLTGSRKVAAGPGQAPPGGVAANLPAHCLVEGVINSREGFGGVAYGINFQLRLPEDWNGRFLLQGGGGLNGSVNPAIGPVAAGTTPALARGFAVASHDSGHQGAVFDASFYADQRAALDFARSSIVCGDANGAHVDEDLLRRRAAPFLHDRLLHRRARRNAGEPALSRTVRRDRDRCPGHASGPFQPRNRKCASAAQPHPACR